MKFLLNPPAKLSPPVRRGVHRLGLALNYFFSRSGPHENVVLLSVGRDGSNLMVDYLNSMPGVSIGGEVLNRANYDGIRRSCISKRAVMRHIRYSLHARGGSVGGVKIHFPQLESRGITLNELHAAFPAAKLLVLYRESLARQYVSTQLAAKTGQWLLRDQAKRKTATISIDRRHLLDYYKDLRAYYDNLLKHDWVPSRSAIVSYEQLTGDPQRLFDHTICPFLKIDSCPVKTKLVKQNTKGLEDTVENYSEVEDLLTGELSRHHYDLSPAEAP